MNKSIQEQESRIVEQERRDQSVVYYFINPLHLKKEALLIFDLLVLCVFGFLFFLPSPSPPRCFVGPVKFWFFSPSRCWWCLSRPLSLSSNCFFFATIILCVVLCFMLLLSRSSLSLSIPFCKLVYGVYEMCPLILMSLFVRRGAKKMELIFRNK